jgi:DNA-directed RNA polymerase specialized sigma24 family protein
LPGAPEDGFTAEQFAEWYDELLRLANVVAPPGVDGADVLHDAVAACLGRVRRRGAVDDPKTYLARAVINQARSGRRRAARRSAVGTVGNVDWGGDGPTVDGSGDQNPMRLLDELPPRQRACLYLRFVEDRSVDDTARLLGCSSGTVKSQTAKALAHLRVDALSEVPE